MPRFTPEKLRFEADTSEPTSIYARVCRQAADDAETLATLTREMRDWCDDVDTSQPIDRICEWLERLEAKR